MTQAAVRDMLSGGVTEGVVVNIASLAAKTGSRGLCSYVASKAGIVGLTKTVALDLADKGIRCNVVLPGFTDTPVTRFLTEQEKQGILAQIPLARSALPREIAEVVAFLCSPESSYMTGAAVDVSGGCGL
ncbi:estradiol 17-beta-dehydrogenase 8 [Ixodes scapularis]